MKHVKELLKESILKKKILQERKRKHAKLNWYTNIVSELFKD